MSVKIYQRKDGKVWHFRGTVSGRRLRGSTGTTDKNLAKRIAAEAEAKAWQRRLDGPGAGLTMAQAFIAYLDAEKPDRFVSKVAAYWKDTPVSEVTPGQVRNCAMKLYPNAKPSTRNRQAIVTTVAAINYCADLGWCSPIKVKRFKVDRKEPKYATEQWVRAFQDHSSPHLGALCRFMFETGARIGEATELQWRDVDFENRTALLNVGKVNMERLARLTPAIVAALANIPSNRRPSDAVFKYVSPKSVRKSWESAVKRAGIEYMSAHACRHGFATKMLRSGKLDAKTVAFWGGWKDVRVLLDTYAHAIKDPSVVDDVFDTDLTQEVSDTPLKHCK